MAVQEHRDASTPAVDPAWRGEFAVAETGDIRQLYMLSGVDPAGWRICGVDVRLSYGRAVGASVFAVERRRLEDADHDWRRLADVHDAVVPVTEFALPAHRAIDILEHFPDLSLVAAPGRAVEGDGIELKVIDRVMPAGEPLSD